MNHESRIKGNKSKETQKRFLILNFLLLASCFLLPRLVSADLPAGNPITFNGIDNIASLILSFMIYMSGAVMVVAIILSGMLMIWSRGEEGTFKKGRDMLKTTVWGSAVIMGSSLIINILTSIFNGTFSLVPAEDIIATLADFIIGSAGVVMITFVVISGIMMMTAGESEDKFKKARKMLTNTIWGSLVIMGSGVILNTVYAVITGEFFCRISILGICLWS